MTVQTRTLRNRLNSEANLGRWDRVLFSVLAEHPTEPAVRRVERILGLLATADECLGEQLRLLNLPTPANKGDFLDISRRKREEEAACCRAVGQINKALKRYRWRSEITVNLEGFWEEVEGGANRDPWGAWESAMVRILLRELTKWPGALSRFRHCLECGRWLYATTAHQRFCGEICRRRHASQSPEFKEKRRTYMRERYRPQQKDLQERSLRNAKGTRKGAK